MDNILSKLQTRLFDLLLLTALSALVLFPALGQSRYLASREIRHAEIIREMAENGDYLIPRLIGKVYYDKPPVMHAAAALLTRIAGKPSMAIARTPSAVAGIFGVLATYGIGLLLFERRSAFFGAIALPGIPGYSLMAREARPDMILCAAILFSCLCLGLGMRKQRFASRIGYFLLAGLLTGLGVVTKGPYALLAPILFAVFTPFRRRDFKRPRADWVGFGLGIIITIALWAIPAYLRDGGEYLRGVIFQPDLDISKGEGGKPFYYVVHGFLFTLPLSLFLPLVIVDLWRRGFSAPLSVAGAIFIVISFLPTKRIHYMLPLYPFLALGIAGSIAHYSKTNRMVRRVAWVLMLFSATAFPLFFAIVQPIIHPSEDVEIVFAKEVLSTVEPDAKLYCVKGEEALAWVGRQHERIQKIPVNSSVSQLLCHPIPKSYLVIDEKNMELLLKVTEPFYYEPILSRIVEHKKLILFRLKGNMPELP